MKSFLTFVVMLMSSVTSCGCSILPAADTVKDRFYVLVTTPGEPGPTAGDRPGRPATLVMARVALPEYLDRPELVTREEDNRISMQRNQRWAEPLVDSVPRVLATDISAILAPANIGVSAHGAASGDLSLVVDVQRFERDAKGVVELWAGWTLTDAPRGVVKSGEVKLSEPAGEAGAGAPGEPDGEATAAAMSRALAKLAGAIGAGVQAAR